MKNIGRKIKLMMLFAFLFISSSTIEVFAIGSYTINGVTVRYTDFSSSPDECWVYANNIYKKIWGVNFTNSFSSSDNMLRNLSDGELTLTIDHLKSYVSNAALGSCLRICNSTYLHGSDGWGHSQIIVQKDANGFAVLEGGLSASPYCREKYYTWSEYCNTGWLGGTYQYIKYIKWPGAPAYSASSQNPNNPFGYLELVTSGVGSVTVKGWAADADVPNQSIGVHFYIVQNGNRQWLGGLTADLSRPDVHNVYPVLNNYHGFNKTFNTSISGTVQVEAYGINVGSGGNTMLWDAPKTVTIPKDTTPPSISNVKVSNITSNGYTVSCTVVDNFNVTRVQFPTWTINGGQDDLEPQWGTSTRSAGSKNGNTYTFQVKRSDHNNEYGTYVTHIYAWDSTGNISSVAVPYVQVNKNCSHNYEWIVNKPATCIDTGSKYQECTICHVRGNTVSIPKLTPTIKLNVRGTIPLQIRKSITIKVSNLAVGDYVKSWTSSNKKIATVTSKGKITATKKTGTTTITVTLASGKKETLKIKVQKGTVKTTKLSTNAGKTLKLKKGKTFSLKYTITPITSTQKVIYKSANKKIATISSKGIIKAMKKGKTTITVSSGSKKVNVKVMVY